MKEKIGMLIELANQYEIEKEKSEGVNVDVYVEFKWDYNNNGLARYDETDRWEGDNLYGDTAVAYLISKSFGMVKWLVENDKIDFRKADADISKDIVLGREPDFADFMVFRRFADDEKVIMLLSISDTPIDDLISYLK